MQIIFLEPDIALILFKFCFFTSEYVTHNF